MFTTRLKTAVPASLKVMLDAVADHPFVRELRTSDNAIGIEAVKSFNVFLSKASALEVLDVSNCGMSSAAGETLAAALLQCKTMRLKEFYGNRQRLENKGVEALSKVFLA